MSDDNQPTTPQPADWWQTSLTRREAGAVALGAAVAVGLSGCCGDDELGEITELESLELQKQSGWDVGDAGKPLTLNNVREKDSLASDAWRTYTDPRKLLAATSPLQAGWRPFERAILFQSLEQRTLADQLKPVETVAMKEAYARGAALATLVTSVKDPEGTLLVVDMPGPESVALAAGMAGHVEPVFFFDNWPHPDGVVPSHETLAATLFYAAELETMRQQREGKKLPAALILDSQRLNPYRDAADAFDNRYLADLPDATQLKKLGISRLLYVTPKPVEDELDDLNDPIVALGRNGVKVNKVALSAFQKDPDAPANAAAATGGYFYGGGYHHHPYFFTHYPMFLFFPLPSYGYSRRAVAPPTQRVATPTWQPRQRQTLFSGRTTGTTAGVGRQKPTGFGRVSTRVGSDGRPVRAGRASGSPGSSGRSGRSGSFGRSRGGSFG